MSVEQGSAIGGPRAKTGPPGGARWPLREFWGEKKRKKTFFFAPLTTPTDGDNSAYNSSFHFIIHKIIIRNQYYCSVQCVRLVGGTSTTAVCSVSGWWEEPVPLQCVKLVGGTSTTAVCQVG